MTSSPKYLVQVLERTTHFCKSFKLLTLDEVPQWVKESKAMIQVAMSYNPTHSYVMYISNNPVDIIKGELKLLQQEATKVLNGESRKLGVFSSTKAAYLGMSREIVTLDFDAKNSVHELQYMLIGDLIALDIPYEYTLTANGIHVHISAVYLSMYLASLSPYMKECLDKYGHDICSPIQGTVKDGVTIIRGKS